MASSPGTGEPVAASDDACVAEFCSVVLGEELVWLSREAQITRGEPDAPLAPVDPEAPVEPVEPVEPAEKHDPLTPVNPVVPLAPVEPLEPEEPKVCLFPTGCN